MSDEHNEKLLDRTCKFEEAISKITTAESVNFEQLDEFKTNLILVYDENNNVKVYHIDDI
jgi:hypothetical protein